MIFMSGCSLGNFSVDALLSPPKLSQEQQGIHEGLIESVGSNIKLKYPRSGPNRSSYLIVNIDDEPTDEAIVFFEYNTVGQINTANKENSGVYFCVLDQNSDGKWRVVDEQVGSGTDVDRIIVSQLDSSGKVCIIVGYSTLNINDKIMNIYSYSNGKLEVVAQDTPYSVMETLDINNDGYSEVITVQSGGENSFATASLLSVSDGAMEKKSVISMSDRFQSVASYIKGKATAHNKALFIDCKYGEGLLSTEFIYYKYDSLQNPVAQIGSDIADLTVRPDGYYCADIDGDGIIEIPTVEVMKGYEIMNADEQLYMTTWSEYRDYYELVAKYSGYYSISNGYMMCFPENWMNNVTVKRDEVTGENVFYIFKDSLEASTDEFMRIAISSRSGSDQYIQSGYQKITSVGQLDYLVRISGTASGSMSISLNDIKRNFYVIA